MKLAEGVKRQIQTLRPHAKFIAASHSSEFIDAGAQLGEGFYTANLYDEQIDANMITTKYGRVMIQNTYIASFAYNLFLCWLSAASSETPELLRKLLAHNFKKFFAEQIYRQKNCVASRALLLETLLFEQTMMVPVFAEKTADEKLAKDADTAASLMSLSLSMHELGHFYEATKPSQWAEVLQAEPAAVESLYSQIAGRHRKELITEFQCDVYATLGCLRQYESYAGAAFALRAIVFAFAAYAAMYSATATAKATAELWKAEPEEKVDLLNIESHHSDYSAKWEIDREFLQRANWVAQVCEQMASMRGLELYGENGPFPLPKTIVTDLMDYVGTVFDCADDNARKMSNLVAQALYGHDAGMEYLYLRSKVFTTRREEPLRVT